MTIYGGEDGEQRHASMKPIQTQVYILITANRLREHSSVNGKNWTIDSLKSWLVCLVGFFFFLPDSILKCSKRHPQHIQGSEFRDFN